ncbi:hypothetical protein PFLUV_G00018890 [Perca fluviatilis]|uniref:Uncharacterized protein n=1 Tax=Perca fluviatilis TaxID=8168 RepID=A0A6A5FPU3_PERFL|nr:hypothetical protein PFLUV_G00018890 [Perca fluviatilis]
MLRIKLCKVWLRIEENLASCVVRGLGSPFLETVLLRIRWLEGTDGNNQLDSVTCDLAEMHFSQDACIWMD